MKEKLLQIVIRLSSIHNFHSLARISQLNPRMRLSVRKILRKVTCLFVRAFETELPEITVSLQVQQIHL